MSLVSSVGALASGMYRSLLGSVAGSVGLGGGLFAGIGHRLFGLSRAEKEANAFTAQQNQEAMAFEERMAQNSMNFESGEAQKNRDFQAQQAATSWQRGVMDMQNAGLNPALAYGQGGASAMQGSTASGATASGHAGSSVTPGTSLSDLIQLAQFKSHNDLLKAQARDINASAALKETDVETRGHLNSASLNEKLQNVENLKESRELMSYQRQVLGPAQKALLKAQADAAKSQGASLDASRVYVDWQNEFKRQNGYWPGTNASSFFWNVIMGMQSSSGPGFDVPAQTGSIPFGFPRN